jgi:signal transduction histidine kinase
MLGSIVSNLIENTVEYTPAGGAVDIRVSADGDGVLLEIDNDAADLNATDIERVFDPFWRKSRVRAQTEHSGLGLALVRALCDAIGASAGASLREGRFSVNVRVPARAGGVDEAVGTAAAAASANRGLADTTGTVGNWTAARG